MTEGKKRTKKHIALRALTALLLVLLAAGLLWLSDAYRADGHARSALASDAAVRVERTVNGWRFDGPGEDALILYPGARVEAAAYAPLLRLLAEGGVDAFLVEMPLHFAMLKVNAADRLIGAYEAGRWFLAGHSLGGVAASSYVNRNPDAAAGLVLLASYPASEIGELPMLSIYGDRDGVLNRERFEKSRALWPEEAQELFLEGGNHAQFGSYGAQKGDGEPTISAEEQQARTAAAILDWIARIKP